MRRGVWVPHSGKRLANLPYGVPNHAGPYVTSSGGEGFFLALPCGVDEYMDRIPVQDETSRVQGTHIDISRTTLSSAHWWWRLYYQRVPQQCCPSHRRSDCRNELIFEGSTISMLASVDAKHPCGQAKRCMLGLVSETVSQKCRFLLSQSCGKEYNNGTIGGWFGCIGNRLVATLVLPTLYYLTRDPPCCLSRIEWSERVYQSSIPYMYGVSR